MYQAFVASCFSQIGPFYDQMRSLKNTCYIYLHFYSRIYIWDLSVSSIKHLGPILNIVIINVFSTTLYEFNMMPNAVLFSSFCTEH